MSLEIAASAEASDFKPDVPAFIALSRLMGWVLSRWFGRGAGPSLARAGRCWGFARLVHGAHGAQRNLGLAKGDHGLTVDLGDAGRDALQRGADGDAGAGRV